MAWWKVVATVALLATPFVFVAGQLSATPEPRAARPVVVLPAQAPTSTTAGPAASRQDNEADTPAGPKPGRSEQPPPGATTTPYDDDDCDDAEDRLDDDVVVVHPCPDEVDDDEPDEDHRDGRDDRDDDPGDD